MTFLITASLMIAGSLLGWMVYDQGYLWAPVLAFVVWFKLLEWDSVR
jgi:hypothetical protein